MVEFFGGVGTGHAAGYGWTEVPKPPKRTAGRVTVMARGDLSHAVGS
jgi:hypothetical protein